MIKCSSKTWSRPGCPKLFHGTRHQRKGIEDEIAQPIAGKDLLEGSNLQQKIHNPVTEGIDEG